MVAPSQYFPRAKALMLATWTGAKSGASWMTILPPSARSITRRSSGAMVRQALGGAAATMSAGVGGFFGAAPSSRAAVVTSNNERIIPLPRRHLSSAAPWAPLSGRDRRRRHMRAALPVGVTAALLLGACNQSPEQSNAPTIRVVSDEQ